MKTLHVKVANDDISEEVESVDITDSAIKLHFKDDFDPARIDEVFYPIYCNDITFNVVITDYPIYFTGRASLHSYDCRCGKRGDLSEYETLTMERP